ASLPRQNLGFPSLVVASGNDPWMTTRNLTPWSEAWGSRLIGIGQAGHINTESGFGPWPMGLALLHLLQDRTRPVSAPHTRRRTRRAGEGSAARRLDD
ncbi:alpha/beta hydrolase, partial [uncultured Thiodictyon sp.]|uniref:RBBP9/YdeN family alpha/beta hydrolase n=1 Tax=uncultured Thiodictyon sp. TaxID=1846217 RepID=UPI0025FF4A93